MLKDYLLKKDRGQLKCTQAEIRFAHALQPANLAPRVDDGYVHFGDLVMLFNQATDGCLACDPQETLSDETFATTSTWYTEPCSRNSFEIQKWTGRGDKKDAMFEFTDDIVRFPPQPHYSTPTPSFISHGISDARHTRFTLVKRSRSAAPTLSCPTSPTLSRAQRRPHRFRVTLATRRL